MKKALQYLFLFVILLFVFNITLNYFFNRSSEYRQWDIQSIDTMKYSRDRARESLNGILAQKEIDKQISDIADTGATHVSIGTPYDDEFIPVMEKWVSSARKHGLQVWFRGNFSGWEQWFGYPKIDKETHTAKLKSFIENNPDLFEDGDIFTSCTECENGSKVSYGNPAEIAAHKAFLLKEYSVTKEAFAKINKKVKSNFYSMNGDLAAVMMDKETTQQFDGVVVIDHYVKEPEQLVTDIRKLADQTGGTIILGEFGAPIPDIHGKMTEEEQLLWVNKAMQEIAAIPQVGGINYWVNKDGTTALWSIEGEAKSTVEVISQYFKGKKHIIKYSN